MDTAARRRHRPTPAQGGKHRGMDMAEYFVDDTNEHGNTVVVATWRQFERMARRLVGDWNDGSTVDDFMGCLSTVERYIRVNGDEGARSAYQAAETPQARAFVARQAKAQGFDCN